MDEKSRVKIDFVNFEEFRDESKSYPVGILSISASLKNHGFTNIGLTDYVCTRRKIGEHSDSPPEGRRLGPNIDSLIHERDRTLEDLLRYLRERQPHIILLGPVTSFYLIELVDLVPKLRELYPNQIIIAGGPHFGKDSELDKELVEKLLDLDGIVVGEAEETIVDVVTQFHADYSKKKEAPARVEFLVTMAGIPGIMMRGRKLKKREPPDLSSLPFPDMELLEKHLGDAFAYQFMPKYRLSNRRNPIIWVSWSIVDAFDSGGSGTIDEDIRYFDFTFASRDARFPFGVIIGSRGCSYHCSFCCTHGPRRVLSAKQIFSQISDVNSRYGIRLFVFFDALFVDSSIEDQKRVEELCRMLCDSDMDIRYMVEIRADIVRRLPDKLLKLMMQSGCVEFNFGLEKGSDRMLQKMTKRISTADHQVAVAKLRRIANELKTRVIVNGTFILGGPEETRADIRETLIHCFGLHLDQATLYPMEVYPGTEVCAKALKEGIIKPGLNSYLNPAEYPLYASENLPRSYLVAIKNKSEYVLDCMEEIKKTMQGVERQFLPESIRDEITNYETRITKDLQVKIEESLDAALDFLINHPGEGLRENGTLKAQIDLAFQKVQKEIDRIEEDLVKKYPDYDYHCGDYDPGTLMRDWKHFIDRFESLFSKKNFA